MTYEELREQLREMNGWDYQHTDNLPWDLIFSAFRGGKAFSRDAYAAAERGQFTPRIRVKTSADLERAMRQFGIRRPTATATGG